MARTADLEDAAAAALDAANARIAELERDLAGKAHVGVQSDVLSQRVEELLMHRVDELERMVRELGQCVQCSGDREESHTDDDGEDHTEACPACDGTGLEPEARAVLAPARLTITAPEPK